MQLLCSKILVVDIVLFFFQAFQTTRQTLSKLSQLMLFVWSIKLVQSMRQQRKFSVQRSQRDYSRNFLVGFRNRNCWLFIDFFKWFLTVEWSLSNSYCGFDSDCNGHQVWESSKCYAMFHLTWNCLFRLCEQKSIRQFIFSSFVRAVGNHQKAENASKIAQMLLVYLRVFVIYFKTGRDVFVWQE